MSTPSANHEAPSLPTSPPPKRPKVGTMAADDAQSGHINIQAPPPLAAAPPLLVKKLSPNARTPTRGSAYAAGYDLYAAKACIIPQRGKTLVDTDIAIAVGEGCCRFTLKSYG